MYLFRYILLLCKWSEKKYDIIIPLSDYKRLCFKYYLHPPTHLPSTVTMRNDASHWRLFITYYIINLVWLNGVCLETKVKGYVYYIYIDEYGEREGKNPFFIGQVKILTIHLKREFNKPVEVSAPEGHCRAI